VRGPADVTALLAVLVGERLEQAAS
jgi:hypothetical protein